MLIYLPELRLNVLEDGPKDGPALVLAHALGLDATMWDTVLPLLPPGLRRIGRLTSTRTIMWARRL